MANDPERPVIGELSIDARALLPFIKDLPEGVTRGMRVAQEGFEGALQEVLANQSEWGDKAGITGSDFSAMQLANDQLAQIALFLPAARKLVELLEESHSRIDDQRQRALHGFARSVEDRAKVRDDGPTLLAKYQKTRAYKAAIGIKAYKTRLRNVRDAEAEEAPEPVPPT